MKKLTKKQKEYKAKRAALALLSVDIKVALKLGNQPFNTVNEGLLFIYCEQTNCKSFRTFYQWKQDGYKVKKGSKGFAIWGSPKNLGDKKDNEEGKDKEKDEFKYYPLCYLFNESQVEKIN